MITEFTPWLSLIGGILIGLSAVILMASDGRIAGISGIMSGILPPVETDWVWRAIFLVGCIIPAIVMKALGHAPELGFPIGNAAIVTGGLIVGVGTAYGSGCTSGHGICGLSRFSPRSLVAVVVFMLTTFITVFVVRHVIGA
jgi:uncharacterized membrane protein YedE/YeeE